MRSGQVLCKSSAQCWEPKHERRHTDAVEDCRGAGSAAGPGNHGPQAADARRTARASAGHFRGRVRRNGDEQAALETAERRFGDPTELSGQLQEAVPWWDRFAAVMEVPNKALYYGPHKSVFHLAGKHFLYMGVCYASFILIFLLPVFLCRGRHLESGLAFRLALRMAVVMGGVMATLSFLVAVVPCEIGRSFFGKDSERSTRRGGFQFGVPGRLSGHCLFHLLGTYGSRGGESPSFASRPLFRAGRSSGIRHDVAKNAGRKAVRRRVGRPANRRVAGVPRGGTAQC